MEIKELYIKNFGKFHEKKLFFQDGLNVIYGENESGKTTVHTFIRAMLFGMPVSRGRFSKHDLYRLYEPWEDSMRYEGSMRICHKGKNYTIWRRFYKNDRAERIIEEESKGILSTEELLVRLGGLTENGFVNTVFVGQCKSAAEDRLVMELKEAIVNLTSSGSAEWDIERAFQYLKCRKKEWERTYQPNLTTTIEELSKELDGVEDEIIYITGRQETLAEEIRQDEDRFACWRDKRRTGMKKHQSTQLFMGIACGMAAGIAILAWILNYFVVACGGAAAACLAILSGKMRQRRIRLEFMPEDENPETGIVKKREEYARTAWQLEKKKEQEAVLVQALEEGQKNLIRQQEIYQEIQALTIAEQRLSQVTEQMQKDFGIRLNHRVSEWIERVTDGMYQDIRIGQELTISIYQNLRSIPIEQVSKGCAEQLYLALRLGAADSILGYEQIPLIFDDTFAFYDECRLLRVLSLLAEESRQMLIFTCHKREHELLGRKHIPHHYISVGDDSN